MQRSGLHFARPFATRPPKPVAVWALLVSLAVPAAQANDNPPTAAFEGTDPTAAIEHFVESRWQANNVSPAEPCSDREFVRRIYLDLLGRIPTLEESRAFLDSTDDDRRSQLVDQLLTSDEHAVHLADVFDTLLMGRGSAGTYKQRAGSGWRAYLERAFRENRPWNEVAREMLLARPLSEENRAATWFLYERKNNHQAIAEAIAPAVFGVRIECAQCHDHPLADEIEQGHYWGLVAFFRRSTNADTDAGPRIAESAIGGFDEFADIYGGSHKNLLRFLGAETVEEERPAGDEKQEDRDDLYTSPVVDGAPRVPLFSRRERFVNKVLADHPLVAKALVNRLWAMMMGRGIVHPFDEMDSVHPPSHPELLEWLAEDCEAAGYDVRRLIRAIALSSPYQLSARCGDVEPADFAWGLEKPLTAEQFARSLSVAVRGKVDGQAEIINGFRDQFPEVLPETNVTLVKHAMFLSNDVTLNEFLAESRGESHLVPRLAALETNNQRIELLFETLFCRLPTAEERDVAVAFLFDRADGLERALDQLVWAAVTSAEFRFNH